MLLESDREVLGLTLLSSDEDNNIVLFSSAGDLATLMQHLDAFHDPTQDGQASRRFEGFVSRIENDGMLSPMARLGVRYREAGIAKAADLQDGEAFTVDIELWDFGGRAFRERKAAEIDVFIANRAV